MTVDGKIASKSGDTDISDEEDWKSVHKLRTEVERYFARLGDREVELTTHYKMKSIKNQMTIAHLSRSLIALAAAVLMKQPQKIRCYRTFAHQSSSLKTAA